MQTPCDTPDVPSLVWLQLSAAERGYLLVTHIGRIPLSAMLTARERQLSGHSPALATVVTALRRMLPVVEATAHDRTEFGRMDLRRLTEMRAVLAEIEAVPLAQAAE
jgi:hypothetical protein